MAPAAKSSVIFLLLVRTAFGSIDYRADSQQCTSGDSCNNLELDVGDSFEDGDAPTLSLLQYAAKATFTKKSQLKSADAEASETFERSETTMNKSYASEGVSSSWPMAFVDPKPNPAPNTASTPVIVYTAPESYRITLGVIIFLMFIAIAIFFITEGGLPGASGRETASKLPIAKDLSSLPYLQREEQCLGDFVHESDQTFIVSVDGRQPLTYKRFKLFINSKAADVSRFGVAGKDRLAVILGDGSEAAVAFWAFSAQCSYCPINHKATDEEIAFTLSDLPAKAVVMYRRELDRVKGYPIIECTPDKETAGLFTLSGKEHAGVSRVKPKRDDIALIIQTSGTTKKPKIVPLTHENLMLCCKTIEEMIGLKETDRSLNFLPLFHIGGIANNVISPVITRSSVICATDFTGEKAFKWIVDYQPTWYYGSPTTHILIMRDHDSPKKKTLRAIRNATAALLPSTAADMTKFWDCEILPAYGMSECTPIASHQTGKLTRLHAVGPIAAPECMIDKTGEICIRGPAVFSGYEFRSHMDEDPNVAAFEGGWFHTGDCGSIDEIGYLAISGRSKELIIRGGENISPFEVEDAVQDPRISEKAAFVVTHEELGEVVGLAVKTTAKPEQLGELFSAVKKNSGLVHYKMPEIIVSVDELPKGLAGKTKRIGLQKTLGVPTRSLKRDDPIAYTFVRGKLTAIEVENEGEDDAVDSLGLTKSKGGVEIPPEIKTTIMAMYAFAAFCVVSYHGQIFTQYPAGTSQVGITLVHMMCGNVIGGMRWTMQCFMGCASYLQCKEPFSATRVFILTLLYFGYQWPISNIIDSFAYLVSQEPIGSYYVMTDKRWFVGVMIISYSSFAFMRHLPFHGLQVLTLAVITCCLNIWPVQNHVLSDILPHWANYWFQSVFVCGLFVWVGCITIYYFIGYYGHDIVARLVNHPLSKNPTFQRALIIVAPIAFFVILFAEFWGPQMTLGMTTEYLGYSWKWDATTVFMDQIVALGMIVLLSQAVRCAAPWMAPVGACSLGIYLGGDICFFLPYGSADKTSASFGIIVDRYQILPLMQTAVVWTAAYWPLMVITVFCYSIFQIFVFGLPFHQCYLKLVQLADAGSRKLKPAK